MLTDANLTFGEDFDLDQETGTYLMTNQVDLGAVTRDIGNGTPVYLCINVTEAFTDGGDSATLTLRLVSDDTVSIHASTSTIHLDTGPFLKAALTAGRKMAYPLPVGGPDFERYLGINCIVGTAGFDTGMISAFLTADPAVWQAYADGRSWT